MDDEPYPPRSHLFTLRLWQAEAGKGRVKWRGQLQHVLSGERRYFQGWPALVTGLRALLFEQRRQPPRPDEEDNKEDEIS